MGGLYGAESSSQASPATKTSTIWEPGPRGGRMNQEGFGEQLLALPGLCSWGYLEARSPPPHCWLETGCPFPLSCR